jgi:hypothetical protein
MAATARLEKDFFGSGPIGPHRRSGKGDWTFGSGATLARSNFAMRLKIRRGELATRPRLGSRLHLLQHKGIDDLMVELGIVLIEEALEGSQFRLTDVEAHRDPAGQPYTLFLRVTFDVLSTRTRTPVLTGLQIDHPIS